MKNDTLAGIILSVYTIVALLVACFFDGTGDAGDSVLHFLYAKYAPVQPELYFDHWAKPVFVLTASPFAQFGFFGMKVFNILVTAASVFLTYKIAQKLELKNAPLVLLFSIFAPTAFVLTFSGLTEPLFALFLAAGIYAALCDRYFWAAIIISFLPFVRSEGLIIIGVFGFYFLLKKQLKMLPVLSVGHVVYSIAGYFVFNELLWVFTRIPYQRLSSIYGSGDLLHFAEQLVNIIGVPAYVLFWAGVLAVLVQTVHRRVSLDYFLLIYTLFFAYFIAHSLFWYLGIFNSMGLTRVLIAVLPVISIIVLTGFNRLTGLIPPKKTKIKRIVQGLIMAYVLVFPFTQNPAAVKWETDLLLAGDQKAILKIADFVREDIGLQQRFVFNHPYLSEALDINHFDWNRHVGLRTDYLDRIESRDIIVWDSWFSVVQENIDKADIEQHPGLEKIYEVREIWKGREVEFLVFRKKE